MKRVMKELFGALGYDLVPRQAPNTDINPPAQETLLLAQTERPVMVDVGALIGQTCAAFADRFNGAIIHLLEPFGESYAALQRNCASV